MVVPLIVAGVLFIVGACSGSESNKKSYRDKEEDMGGGDTVSTIDIIETGTETVDVTKTEIEQYLNNCHDKDKGIDPEAASSISYLDNANSVWRDAYDVCKTDKILAERYCDNYVDGETDTEASLTKYIFCDCKDGKCVNDIWQPCTDPLPESPPEGGTVWQWEAGNLVLDFCETDNSVRHITCDSDGKEKQDITPCPEGKDCVDGICGGTECVDTDPEDNPLIFGQIILSGNTSINDYCDTFARVVEVSCDTIYDGSHVFTTKDCPDDHYCVNGACVPSELPLICKNDTDPLQDQSIIGVVDMVDPQTESVLGEYYDSCSSLASFVENDVNENHIYKTTQATTEYYCDGGVLNSKILACSEGTHCDDGVCVEGEPVWKCEDDDNGNIFVSGFITMTEMQSGYYWSHSDFCITDLIVGELSCLDEGRYLLTGVSCPEGNICAHGVCVGCTDDDLDNDPKKLGQGVDVLGVSHSDYCVGNKVVQVNCNAEGMVDAGLPEVCESGVCQNGVCK